MSGGEQQRTAVARALIHKPALILADEPTGNLDSRIGAEVMDLLRELNAEQLITLIVVTHDADVAAYADRIVHLRDGAVVDIETTANGRELAGAARDGEAWPARCGDGIKSLSLGDTISGGAEQPGAAAGAQHPHRGGRADRHHHARGDGVLRRGRAARGAAQF